jgi:Concanavalin A-like lectin/glucanases superfamily
MCAVRRTFACILGFALLLAQTPVLAQTRPRATNYAIPTDVQAVGGGEAAKSTNYLLDDTIGEGNIGESRSATYQLDAGYRQTAVSSIALSCGDTVNMGNISLYGQATGTGSCTVITDSEAGYALSWKSGADEGLAGYWPFDETTGTTSYDHSGNAWHGTHVNTPTISADVPSHFFSTRSLQFNGSTQYVDLGTSPVFEPARITVAGWINTTDNSASQTVASKVDTVADQGWELRLDSGNLEFVLNDNTVASVTAPSANQWHHVAGTYDGTNIRVYLNGILRNTVASSAYTPSTRSAKIGARTAGGTIQNYFSGNLDDIRLYSRSLSAPEIALLASKAPAGSLVMSGSQVTHIAPFLFPSTGGLVGQWRMDEPVSGTVADSSGYDHDGTPNGASGVNNKPQPSTNIPTGVTSRDYRSLNFDGTDDHVAFTSALSSSQEDITISTWAYGTPTFKVLVSLGTEVWLGTLGGRWTFNTKPGQYMQSPGNAASGWHHIVATHDGSTARLYVDGVEVNSTAGDLGDPSGSSRIGDYSGGSYNWPGYIDDVRIYDRTLTPEEIKGLYGLPQTWTVANNDAAFGARLRSNSTDTDSKWGTDVFSDKWLAIGGGSYTVVSRGTSNHPTGSTQNFQYRTEVGASKIQPAGVYQSTLTITAVAL